MPKRLCVLLACLATSLTAAEPTRYRITDEVLHPIDHRLFGQFLERPSWGGETGPEFVADASGELDADVMDIVRRIDPPIVRYPGGTDIDYLDWTDLIDNAPGRDATARPDSVGHKGGKITNRFGLDEYLNLAEAEGWQSILVVNFRDALMEVRSMDDAKRHAAAMIAYVNGVASEATDDHARRYVDARIANGRTKPWAVKIWQIGNETWAFEKELREKFGDDAMQTYADRLVAVADAMTAVDPTIRFIVDGQGYTYDATSLAAERLGDRLEAVADHIYQPWGIGEVTRNGEPVDASELSAEEIWSAWVATPDFDEAGLAVHRSNAVVRARERGEFIGCTEWNWNGWWGTEPVALNSRYAKGVGAAGFLQAMMRGGDVIRIGCQSMLIGHSWGIAAVDVDGDRHRPPVLSPTGAATTLYRHHHGDRRLRIESADVPTYRQPYRMNSTHARDVVATLDALATADDDSVYLHVINRSWDTDLPIEITTDRPIGGGPTVHRMSPDGLDAATLRSHRIDAPESDGQLRLTIPARTVNVIELPTSE